jgi:FkbM family methyltransferase
MNMAAAAWHKVGIYVSVCTGVRNPWSVVKNQIGWLPPGERILELRNGMKFRCRANTPDINQAVVVGLAREYPVRPLQRLPPGATVLDLGAHIGSFAILAARLRSDVTIHAYEPSSENLRLLRQNLILNGVQHRVTTYRAAVSDADGLVHLRVGGPTDAFDVMAAPSEHVSGDGSMEEVPARTLSSILGELGTERLDLLKMDVEGSEYAVLESSADAIAKCDHVLMEWHDDPRGRRNVEWLIARLRQLQFDVDRPRANLIVAARPRLHGSATAL